MKRLPTVRQMLSYKTSPLAEFVMICNDVFLSFIYLATEERHLPLILPSSIANDKRPSWLKKLNEQQTPPQSYKKIVKKEKNVKTNPNDGDVSISLLYLKYMCFMIFLSFFSGTYKDISWLVHISLFFFYLQILKGR